MHEIIITAFYIDVSWLNNFKTWFEMYRVGLFYAKSIFSLSLTNKVNRSGTTTFHLQKRLLLLSSSQQ